MQTRATIPFSHTPGITESGACSHDTAIVLLGFWHSGQPVLERVLERLGVFLDRSGRFPNLNRRLLSASGGDWKNPPMVGDLNASRLAARFQKDLDQVTGHIGQVNRLWGWSEPMTMVTWPVYQRYFSDRRRRYKVVYLARDLEATATLLAANRPTVSVRYARLLASAYRSWATASLHSEPNKSRWWLVDYEQLVTDRDTAYHEIARFIRS